MKVVDWIAAATGLGRRLGPRAYGRRLSDAGGAFVSDRVGEAIPTPHQMRRFRVTVSFTGNVAEASTEVPSLNPAEAVERALAVLPADRRASVASIEVMSDA